MTDRPLLSRLDLNLLVSLDALLTERSVTRAAEQLRLSQPALSASLARLRRHFDDPLLVRRGNSYELTALATRLAVHTSTALESARRVFESQTAWVPAQSEREFSIYGSDYGFVTVGAIASRLAEERAPGVRLRFLLHTPSIVEDAVTKLRSADGMIIPHGPLSDLPHEDLWNDDWMALVAEESAVGEVLTMEEMAAHPWVLTYQSRSSFTSAAREVQQLGIDTHAEVVLESFLPVPHFVAETDRIGLIQASLVPRMVRAGGVRAVRLPFESTPLVNALWWHPAHTADPEHAWMRDLFAEAGRMVHAAASPGTRGDAAG